MSLTRWVYIKCSLKNRHIQGEGGQTKGQREREKQT